MKELLTKQMAIEKHREMWRWILEQYEQGSILPIDNLKMMYCKNKGYKPHEIFENCFCCEYAEQQRIKNEVERSIEYGERCKYCPVTWGTEEEVLSFFCENGIKTPVQTQYGDTITNSGLWLIAYIESSKSNRDIGKIKMLVKQIAELEENKNV